MPSNHISNKPYHDWLKEDAERKKAEQEFPSREPNAMEHLLDVIRKCDLDSAVGLSPKVPSAIIDALPKAVKYCDEVRDDFLDVVRQLIEVRLEYLKQRKETK